MKRILSVVLMIMLTTTFVLNAQQTKREKTDAHIFGHVIDAETGEHVPGVNIFIKGTTISTVSDATGHFKLINLPLGEKVIVMKFVGYKTKEKVVDIKKDRTLEINFTLEEDISMLDAVVVSANRNETTRRLAPTLVNVVDSKLFFLANANNLAQGVSFQPGVRVENNCQNCGFNQIRINGLEGRYTQILIDSRPVMSSLAGVYGLEQIPTNMIDRVEVVRGGGSALFGSSAIAGVLNIITKEPSKNSFTVNESLGFTGMKEVDNNVSFNGAFISDDQKAGAMLFGQMRYRNPWDANGDAFSEIGKIDARSLGVNTFIRTSTYSRLTAEIHGIQEFRRGGDHVTDEWPAHVAAVAEQTDHSVYSGNVKFDLRSEDAKHHFQSYISAQTVNRKSYYGGIGDLEGKGTIGNPVPKDMYGDNYGSTKGRTYVGGMQYSYDFDKFLFMPAQLLAGVEYTKDTLYDIMPIRSWATEKDGKGNDVQLYPALDQKINNWSQFTQIEWKNEKVSLLLGARIDKHSEVKDLIISPRATFRYNPTQDINLRATYAKGFRAPQVFDEDLHVAVVGGEAKKVFNDPNLKPEISHALSISADVYKRFGELQTNFLVEGFHTRLQDVFAEEERASEGDKIKRFDRVNGSGAKIFGANLEAKLAYRTLQLQMGATITSNKYDEAQEWGERTATTDGKEPAADGSNFKKDDEGSFENEAQKDIEITRTPTAYGYFTLGWNPVKPLNVSLTGTFTGSMYVPHAIEWGVGSAVSDIDAIKAGKRTAGFNDGKAEDAAAPRWDELQKTPSFFDLGAKITYDFNISQSAKLQVYAGMNNIFNSFQKDFDRGASRDSGYIYGPTQPRTIYFGCRYSF